MKVYLAGPMRGYDLFNFPAFAAAAARLRRAGIEVVSPAEMDLEMGLDPSIANTAAEAGFDVADALMRDFAAIQGTDGVALLEGAEHSKGAQAERAFAVAIGKGVWAYVDGRTSLYTGIILAGTGQNRNVHVPPGFDHFADEERVLHEGRSA